jgi:hypothetical protein
MAAGVTCLPSELTRVGDLGGVFALASAECGVRRGGVGRAGTIPWPVQGVRAWNKPTKRHACVQPCVNNGEEQPK